MKKAAIIMFIAFQLFSVSSFGERAVEKSFAQVSDIGGFLSVPLQSRIHSRLSGFTTTFQSELTTDSGSFAYAGDFYAYSNYRKEDSRKYQADSEIKGKTVFFDKSGKILSETSVVGSLQRIGDKILLVTPVKKEMLLFSYERSFEPVRFSLVDGFLRSLYITLDDCIAFVFKNHVVLADSISVDKEGKASLTGRRIDYSKLPVKGKADCLYQLTRYGYTFLQDGKIHARRFGEGDEFVETVVDAQEPYTAIEESWKKSGTYLNSGIRSSYSRCLVTSNTLVVYLIMTNKAVVAIKGKEGWKASYMSYSPSPLVDYNRPSVYVNSKTSEVLLPCSREVYLFSEGKRVRLNGESRFLSSLDRIEMVDDGFRYLNQVSRVCTLSAGKKEFNDARIDIAFPFVKVFSKGFVQVSSDRNESTINVMSYPDFASKPKKLSGRVYCISDISDGRMLLCSETSDNMSTVYSLKCESCEIKELLKIEKDRSVKQLYCEGNNSIVLLDLLDDEVDYTLISLDAEGDRKEYTFPWNSVRLVLDMDVSVFSASTNYVIVETNNWYHPNAYYLLRKGVKPQKLDLDKSPVDMTDPQDLQYDSFPLAYSFNGKDEISRVPLLDFDNDIASASKLLSRMYLPDGGLLHNIVFLDDVTVREHFYCLIVDANGGRHLHEIDDRVGAVFAASSNPDVLYTPSIVPRKILKYSAKQK